MECDDSGRKREGMDKRRKYTVSQKKTVQNFFLTWFRQISTKCRNFWQKDSKEAKIMRGAFIFHLT